MLEKPYIIRGNTVCWSCVVKIKYGNKYVIAKLMSQAAGLKNIENGLNAFIRGGKNNPAGIYFHLYNYVQEHPDNKFKVETLLDSDNGYLLLKREQQELDKGRSNPNFLNNQTEAIVPTFNPDKDMFGWLKKNEFLNFRKWMKAKKSVALRQS